MTDNAKLMRLACVLFAAKIVMLAILAVNTRFVMDELWQFGQTKYLWNGFYDTIWPVKSVGYALWYAPAHAVGWDATSTLMAGRVWGFGTVLATLAVIGAIARRLGYSWLATMAVLLLLLSVSTYMERSFRLRSETPAILFAALSLWVVMRADALPGLRSVLMAGVLTGCAFLCTQKAIYFNVALGLALVAVVWRGAGLLAAMKAGVTLIAGCVLAILGYCVIFGGADALSVLRQLFVGPADLATQGGRLYVGLEKYIFQTLLRNLPLYVIFILGLVLALSRFRAQPPAVLTAAIFTAVITGLVFAHNQPWPYIFAMCLPFLALWAPVLWDRIILNTPQRARIAPIVVALLVVISFSRNLAYLDHGNAEQLEVIGMAEAILGEDGTYFDGIGMVPTSFDRPRRWLDAQGIRRVQADPDDLMQALADAPPDLIIETERTDKLPAAFADWTAAHFVAAAPGLLVRGTRVIPGATARLTVLEKARFDVAGGADGSALLLDGAAVSWPQELAPGTYRVSLAGGDAPVLILPEGTPVPDRQAPRQSLFYQIYTR